MTELLLTLNAGSSSVKFAVFSVLDKTTAALARGQVEGLGGAAVFHAKMLTTGERVDAPLAEGTEATHAAALASILNWICTVFPEAPVIALGHRVVHGGTKFSAPCLIDEHVMDDLRRLIPLAPLHQPHNIAGIDAARAAFPGTPQVACFDTAFHRGHPFVADTFALPRRFYEEGVRRYGFHGLSYEFVTRQLNDIAPEHRQGKVIVAHLGNGASMCAIRDGRSISSTMGFTALDGLPMGTRCGQLDPGVVLYLMAEKQLDAKALSDLLYAQSGLKGLSGISGDMRELEASDRPEAGDAIAYFVSRIKREIGGLSAVLGGLDTIVFTGGIGENSVHIRDLVLEDMGWLGIRLDRDANAAGASVITTVDSAVLGLVVRTDEEAMIAEHALSIAMRDRVAAAA
jgi:acetate kinase